MDIHFTDALRLKDPKVFSLMIKPAGASCNLRCTYCYYLEKQALYSGEKLRMSDELLEYFTKQYIESNNAQTVTFTWQGGEPTLMGLDFFRKALELQKKYAGDKIIENSFQTNGTRLTPDWCTFFSDNNILVGISIDGPEHNHDHYRRDSSGRKTFSKVMHGIDLLHRYNVEFNTLSVVNDYNVHFATETYRFLKKTGSGFIQFLPVAERTADISETRGLKLVSPSYGDDAYLTEWSVGAADYGNFLNTVFDEWVKNDVARYFVQIFDVTLANYVGSNPGLCAFSDTCGDALVMEHNGDIYSCDHFVYPEYLLGNITETPMIDIAGLQRQFDFGVNKRNNLPLYCLKCDVLYACHGECPKHRFLLTPDGKPGLNYLCEGYRIFFKHVEPYMEYMAKELRSGNPPANVMTWIRNKEKQVIRPVMPNRNDPCPCGSGKKFKSCCAGKFPYQVQ